MKDSTKGGSGGEEQTEEGRKESVGGRTTLVEMSTRFWGETAQYLKVWSSLVPELSLIGDPCDPSRPTTLVSGCLDSGPRPRRRFPRHCPEPQPAKALPRPCITVPIHTRTPDRTRPGCSRGNSLEFSLFGRWNAHGISLSVWLQMTYLQVHVVTLQPTCQLPGSDAPA